MPTAASVSSVFLRSSCRALPPPQGRRALPVPPTRGFHGLPYAKRQRAPADWVEPRANRRSPNEFLPRPIYFSSSSSSAATPPPADSSPASSASQAAVPHGPTPGPPAASGTVYVHWPYCAQRCSYCNFNKYVEASPGGADDDGGRWRRALTREAKTLLDLADFKRIRSVFFGGGTPSRMRPDTVRAVLSAILSHDETLNEATDEQQAGIEVTLESNPGDLLPPGRLQQFLDAGINRVSLGVQSLDDKHLEQMNRDHSARTALQSLELSLNLLGSYSVSVDLIFGRPGQTLEQWQWELDKILQYPLEHVSLYQLTLERGTQLWKDVSQGRTELPCEDAVADMYEAAVATLGSRGLLRYEVSNFARPGRESRHNSSYWDGTEYVGVGPGAHGRFLARNSNSPAGWQRSVDVLMGQSESDAKHASQSGRQARIQTLEPDAWLREVERVGHATRKIQELSAKESLAEFLISGLRTKQGVRAEKWRELSKCGRGGGFISLQELLARSEKCGEFAREGLLLSDDEGLRLSDRGLNIADHILPYLLVALDEV